MPIKVTKPIQRSDQTSFKNIDYEVMGHAIRTHRELGRLFDEKVYAKKLAGELTDAGLHVEQEV